MDVVFCFLLAAHLLCVNLAAGGPIVAAWLDWRSCHGDEAAAQAALWLGRWSVALLPAGAALGVAVGWLRWDADYAALWTGPLSYKMHWAIVEAIFSLVLVGIWWLMLPGKAGGRKVSAAGRSLLALLAATNLLYHFPLLFSVAARLHDAGQTTGPRITGSAFRRLMLQGETPSLTLHVAAASVAVAGIWLLPLSLRLQRSGQEPRAARIATWGGQWALLPSLAQLPLGLWTLLSLPAQTQAQLLGSDALASLLFVAAIFSSFWLLSDLVKISFGESRPALLLRTLGAMILTTCLMTAMRYESRAHPPRPDGSRAFLDRQSPLATR